MQPEMRSPVCADRSSPRTRITPSPNGTQPTSATVATRNAGRSCKQVGFIVAVLYIAQVPEDDLRILQTGYQVRPLPYEAIELDR